jgi:hypothetical protein
VAQALVKDMTQSPVAYAGWTEDLKVFLRLVPALVLPCMLLALHDGVPKWEVRVLQGLDFAAHSDRKYPHTHTRQPRGLCLSTPVVGLCGYG